MEFKEFTAGPDDNDRRLDRILRKFTDSESLSGLYKAVRKGLVKVNDKKTEQSAHVFQGDIIKIAAFLLKKNDSTSDSEALKTDSDSKPLDIVFKNQHLLVINKPYDKTVHGSSDSLDRIVQDYYKTLPESRESLSFTPGPLHRLDRKTTGLLAFSLSLNGARWFSENISTHVITKKYVAILQGNLNKPQKWIDYISKEYDEKAVFQTVSISSADDRSDAKKAVSGITPLKHGTFKGIPWTYAEIQIETGRTHQIRSQCAHHGFPLLGDSAYGGRPLNGKKEFFLHAKELCFPKDNPVGLPEKIICEPDEYFSDFILQN